MILSEQLKTRLSKVVCTFGTYVWTKAFLYNKILLHLSTSSFNNNLIEYLLNQVPHKASTTSIKKPPHKIIFSIKCVLIEETTQLS